MLAALAWYRSDEYINWTDQTEVAAHLLQQFATTVTQLIARYDQDGDTTSSSPATATGG
jgi:hypothetical protein